jgi:hypothetical protein
MTIGLKPLLIGLMVLMLIGSSLSFAGTPQGPKPKLPAPLNVTCPVVEGSAVVSWDLVEGASAYQVEYVGILADGTIITESDFVLAPPDAIALDDFTALIVHVRGLPAPKKADHPVQGAGPKGHWSEPCAVEIVVP